MMLNHLLEVIFIKPLRAIFICLFFLFSAASAVQAEFLSRPDYAVGWQYTSIASGISVKFPLGDHTYVQPIFALSLYDGDGQTEGNYALGLRGTLGFPTFHDLNPYIGWGIGHQRSFHGASFSSSSTDEERTGFQAFFGLEYRRHSFRPALELGVTGIHRSDGSLRVGTSINLGVHYYF